MLFSCLRIKIKDKNFEWRFDDSLMTRSVVTVLLSVCGESLCIVELWSEILGETQLELAVVYNSRIETDIYIGGFTLQKSLYLEAPDKFNVYDNGMCYGLVLQIVYPLIHISFFSFLLCKLFLLLTISSLKCYKL